jgi:type IV pilus assembly protein PilO
MAGKFSLKKTNVRDWALIISAGLIGLILWYYSVYNAKRLECGKFQTQLDQKRKELNGILALKPQLDRLEQEITAAQHRLDSLKSIFPDHKEVPRMIKEITAVARASGIYTTKFTPQPDVERDYYVENNYELSANGAYHDLARFFSFLANMPLIINLSNVSIKANPKMEESKKDFEEHGSPVTTVKASFTITTFSSKK